MAGLDASASGDNTSAATQLRDFCQIEEMRINHAIKVGLEKTAGHLPASLVRLLGTMLVSRVPWERVLREFLRSSLIAGNLLRFPRTSRRREIPDGLVMPGANSEKLGGMTIAIDCSGSIGRREFDLFMAEALGAATEFQLDWLEVLLWDVRVTHEKRFSREDLAGYQTPEELALAVWRQMQSDLLIGGGGTDPTCVVRHIAGKGKHSINLNKSDEDDLPNALTPYAPTTREGGAVPSILIFLTDGLFDPDAVGYIAEQVRHLPRSEWPAWDTRVLWVLSQQSTAMGALADAIVMSN